LSDAKEVRILLNWKRVLVLAPHTDDAELGCGATLVRLVERQYDVFVAVFSIASESLPGELPRDTLKHEFFDAMRVLCISGGNALVREYPVRRLAEHRQSILEELVALRKEIAPDVVFLPCEQDVHQDHQVIHSEGVRAFKNASLLGYELPWNTLDFAPQLIVGLEDRHMEAKWDMLRAYNSQIVLGRRYFSKDLVYGLARVRGAQANKEFGEGFQVIRLNI
jgi:LmbE family N-acetylglucosaminyl deacetylase